MSYQPGDRFRIVKHVLSTKYGEEWVVGGGDYQGHPVQSGHTKWVKADAGPVPAYSDVRVWNDLTIKSWLDTGQIIIIPGPPNDLERDSV